MKSNDAPLLLDASRLVWRRWSGTRATGIDRICHAWIEHYGPQAQAVIIHRKGQAILPFRTSQALFRMLQLPERTRGDLLRFRSALAALIIGRSGHLRDRLEGRGRLWLNPGHTGLDTPGLGEWIRRRGLRPVHLIHDLIPITHPQFCREGEDERHRRRMRNALETACGVVANSAYTLATLSDFAATEGTRLPPSTVAWPGTPILPPASPQKDSEPTFVILGTIEGRKNHNLLLSLWRRLTDAATGPVPRLIIVGRRGWRADDVIDRLERENFAGKVIEMGPLDDPNLAKVLSGARALLFPSFAEGYGIPLIEALAAGVPVIASDLPVFREIGQGVPELLSATDHDAWHEAILDYANPASPRRAEQLQRMIGFRPQEWRNHFTELDDFLSRLTAGPRLR